MTGYFLDCQCGNHNLGIVTVVVHKYFRIWGKKMMGISIGRKGMATWCLFLSLSKWELRLSDTHWSVGYHVFWRYEKVIKL